ncbi:hypothetical protein GCM10027415_09040 [Humibacter ginsengisoli]
MAAVTLLILPMVLFGPLIALYYLGRFDLSVMNDLIAVDILIAQTAYSLIVLIVMLGYMMILALRGDPGATKNPLRLASRSVFAWAAFGCVFFASLFQVVSAPNRNANGYPPEISTAITIVGLAAGACMSIAWWRFGRARKAKVMLPPREFTLDAGTIGAGADFPQKLTDVLSAEDALGIADSIEYRSSLYRVFGTGLMLAGGAFFATAIVWAVSGEPSIRAVVMGIPFGLWLWGYFLTSKSARLAVSADRLRERARLIM